MRNKLCQVDFITFWDDGVISVDGGVGYTGELCTMETMELYQALRKFFEVEKVSSHNTGSPKLLAIIDSALSCINDGELVGAHFHVDKLRKQLWVDA